LEFAASYFRQPFISRLFHHRINYFIKA